MSKTKRPDIKTSHALHLAAERLMELRAKIWGIPYERPNVIRRDSGEAGADGA